MKTSASQPEEYDLVILGSGESGKSIAWAQAKTGLKTAVIERKYIGGSCPNIACLPSKNVIHSAKVASYFFRSGEFGITKDNVKISMAGVRERKRRMVASEVQLHLEMYKKSGTTLVIGNGRFIGPKTIEVTSEQGSARVLRGKRVVINTGSRATIDPTPGLTEAKPMTHIEALELGEIPGHLLIIGGGYIGLEFAQAMRRFGARVTVIERNARMLHREDEDISSAMHEVFQEEGIEIVTGTTINRVEGRSGEWVKLHATREGSNIVVEGTHILVATGRKSNTENIGLDVAGVQLTDSSDIKVNERLETTAPDVWAVGDCAGSPHFTHIAYDDHRVARDNFLGGHRVTTGRQVPFCMFTDPEFARIGLSETEAKEQKIAYRLAKIPMASVLRAITLAETRGFMKALVDAKSDKILGLTIFGVGAGDTIAVAQVAMLAGMPYTALTNTIFTHPTLSEGLIPLFSTVPPLKQNTK